MRALYKCLIFCILPLAFLRLAWRSISRKNPAYRKRWSERLGFVPFSLKESIWIHAASVGETLAAQALIKALRERYPELPIVLTTMTITGSERVRAIYKDALYHVYVPYDVSFAAKRFLKAIRPRIAIMIETELWPTLFAECQKAKIPLMIANARLSEKSARGYRRISALTKDLLQAVTVLAVQTTVEAERFKALNMPAERILVTGSIKFDMDIPLDLNAKAAAFRLGMQANRPVWVAASTHPSEEEVMLNAHQQLLKHIPNLLLILVPRHPERFDLVAKLVTDQGFTLSTRSQSPQTIPADTTVYLGDSMGEMLLWFAVCDIACIGGSFVSLGGHNMLEAALLAKPSLIGSSMFNFADISEQLIAAGGMQSVPNAAALYQAALPLLQDPALCQSKGQAALAVALQNRGALAKHLKAIESILSKEHAELINN